MENLLSLAECWTSPFFAHTKWEFLESAEPTASVGSEFRILRGQWETPALIQMLWMCLHLKNTHSLEFLTEFYAATRDDHWDFG